MSSAQPEMNHNDIALLSELEPTAESLLNRHLEKSKEWIPAFQVPHSLGSDFPVDYQWSPEEFEIPDAVRSALFVNLLTEDNLPYYFRDIERMFGREGAWGTWARRWTAEENRHATVIRDYLTATRAVDPVELERGRMIQMSGGKVPEPQTAADGLIYVTLQELATRISHRNTGVALEAATKGTDHERAGRVGYDVMRLVAIDENHHHVFYRDMAKAVIEVNPSMGVMAMERQIIGFEMPGEGIPEFKQHAREIALAGIYDIDIFYNSIIKAVVMSGGVGGWDLNSIQGLTPDAEQSRERLNKHIDKLSRVAERTHSKKEARLAAS